MNRDAVQHERGPRNSTLRRQMSLYFKDQASPPPPPAPMPSAIPASMHQAMPNFAAAVTSAATPMLPPPTSLSPPHFMTPLNRPSPPFAPLTPPVGNPAFNYHLHLSLMNEV